MSKRLPKSTALRTVNDSQNEDGFWVDVDSACWYPPQSLNFDQTRATVKRLYAKHCGPIERHDRIVRVCAESICVNPSHYLIDNRTKGGAA